MSDNYARVYHPTLTGSFQDVKSSDVESWSKAGWLKTKPKGFDDTDVPAVGTFHIAGIEADVTDEAAPAAKSDAKS